MIAVRATFVNGRVRSTAWYAGDDADPGWMGMDDQTVSVPTAGTASVAPHADNNDGGCYGSSNNDNDPEEGDDQVDYSFDASDDQEHPDVDFHHGDPGLTRSRRRRLFKD